MGKIIVHLKLTNYSDLILRRLKLAKGKPRTVEVDALVDTGATRLYLKPSVIKKLGLARTDTATRPRDTLAPTGGEGGVRGRSTNPPRKPCRGALKQMQGGDAIRYKYEPVELELMERRETFDVIEVPETVPNLLGQVPLEVLDFVVDSKGQRLIPNPAHGGEQMTEEY
jgi:predicted aspartyl protease